MALIITPTLDKKIYVKGTNIELSQIYLRLSFLSKSNGITMEIYSSSYIDRSEYMLNNPVASDLPDDLIVRDIDPLTQVQGLDAAHEIAKVHYEEIGYTVTIDIQ